MLCSGRAECYYQNIYESENDWVLIYTAEKSSSSSNSNGIFAQALAVCYVGWLA